MRNMCFWKSFRNNAWKSNLYLEATVINDGGGNQGVQAFQAQDQAGMGRGRGWGKYT